METVNKLKETVYYQGTYTVENYIDKFQTLIFEASYTDSCTIVIKFYYGLKIAI